jgi:hypothetical protein
MKSTNQPNNNKLNQQQFNIQVFQSSTKLIKETPLIQSMIRYALHTLYGTKIDLSIFTITNLNQETGLATLTVSKKIADQVQVAVALLTEYGDQPVRILLSPVE